MIIWFTGLSGSGKTVLSSGLKKTLEQSGYSVGWVDGDIFRKKQKNKNQFSREEILANNYQIISHCQTTKKDYDFLIISVISPYQETRDKARQVFGKEYLEIFLDCPLDMLIKRDPKKLYQKALKGKIKNLIGFSHVSPYERPNRCDLKIDTDKINKEDSLKMIRKLLEKKDEENN